MMKRWNLLLVCLVLALTLAVAAQMGGLAEDQPELTLASGFVDDTVWALAPLRGAVGEPHMHITAGYVRINNYGALAPAFGESPSWSVRQTAGASLQFEERSSSAFHFIDLSSDPPAAGDYVFEVTCAWGGQTATESVVFRVIDAGLPTDTTVPAMLNMNLGETLPLNYAFVPAGWGSGSYDYIITSTSQTTTQYLQIDWNNRTLTAIQPGITQIALSVCDTEWNVEIEKIVTVRIADENGNVPEPQPVLTVSRGEERTWAVVPEGGVVDRPTSMLLQVGISNYAELTGFLEGSPEWSVVQTGGRPLAYSENDWGQWYYVYSNNMLSTVGDYTFQVTCSWGGQTVAKTVTIHCVEMALPTGSNIPSTLNMRLGESLTLDCDFVPAGWSDAVQTECSFDITTAEYLKASRSNGKTVLTALKSGILQFEIAVSDYERNVSVQKYVTVRIADENGNVPEPELILEADEEEKNWALLPSQAEFGMPQRRVPYVGQISIKNYRALSASFGGEPGWTVVQTAGESLYSRCETHNGMCHVYLQDIPTAPGDFTFEVTCSWGGLTATKSFTIHYYVETNLPTGTNIPDEITMQLGERLLLNYDFLPAGWCASPESYRGYSESALEYLEDSWTDGRTVLTALNPGVTQIGLCVSDPERNLCIWKNVTVRIADENGNVPEPELKLQMDNGQLEITRVHIPATQNPSEDAPYILSSALFSAYIENQETLAALYGGSPEWSVVQTAGQALRLTCWDDGMWNYVETIDGTIPLGDYAFQLNCSWGGKTASETVIVHVVERELPTGSTLPSELNLTVGETIVLDYDFVPAGWSENPEIMVSGYQDMWDLVSRGWTNDGKTTLTARQPGIAQISLTLYDPDLNVAISKDVVMRIADQNGNVPIPEPDLFVSYGENRTWALTPVNAQPGDPIPFFDYIISVRIRNNDIISAVCDEEPIWSTVQTGGPSQLSFTTELDDDWYRVTPLTTPSVPGVYTFQVICAWGGRTVTKTVTINYVTMDLPADITVPPVMYMTVGQSFPLDFRFVPADWSEDPTYRWMVTPEFNEYLRYGWSDDGITTFTALKAGDVPFEIYVGDYKLNVAIKRTVTIHITEGDEAGYTKLYLPAGLRTIDTEAFAGTSANVIFIPDNCTRIGSRAFAGCAGLVRVVIPGDVTIADDAFAGCKGFTIVTGSDAVAAWAQSHNILCERQ